MTSQRSFVGAGWIFFPRGATKTGTSVNAVLLVRKSMEIIIDWSKKSGEENQNPKIDLHALERSCLEHEKE